MRIKRMQKLRKYGLHWKGEEMDENNNYQIDELLQSAPGGIAKLAFDELLTILFATEKFYSTIKNVSEKPELKAPSSLLRIVYSADIIYVTQQLAAQKQRTDHMISLNFRTLQQDGSFKWIMVTGNRMQEVYQTGNKTVPVYSCIAMDMTDLMVRYKKLEQTADYQRVITDLSKDLYFEYEIATDTLSFTELFREVFGKDATVTGFRKRIEKTKVIHPDEQPAVVKIFNSMMSGRKQARFELRLIPKDGNPIWYLCFASIIFDDNRNPYKVVGKLSTTNYARRDTETVTPYVPQLDSLTKVCNKDSTEIMINEVLKKQDTDSLGAFLVIDIRNYKNINEIRRAIQGENVLTTVGSILKDRFRTTDIIGRVGLSEFVVYMKGISSDHIAYEKADKICKAIETIYSYEHTKNSIVVSVGIAFSKGGQDYQTLISNANTALIMAKKSSASSFEVFSGIINN